MRNLEGRVALVTGAAGGIGSAICKRLLEESMTVIACDIDKSKLDELVESMDSKNIHPLVLDITNKEDVNLAVNEVVSKHGAVETLINNAGWDIAKPFLETEPDFWDKVISINLLGPLNLHHALLPHMIENGGGKVVNIASDAGRVGSSGEAVYSACKGGIIAFTKTISRECANKGIRANTVCPGPTDTALFRSFVGEGDFGQKIYDGLKKAIPLKRVGEPEDIPGLVAFLSSKDADFITGQTISVSGGLTMHG
jgi:2-hydroxycyclohexanecarboxyl-CoA dehydrogenase